MLWHSYITSMTLITSKSFTYIININTMQCYNIHTNTFLQISVMAFTYQCNGIHHKIIYITYQAPVVSLSKKLYPYGLVLVGSRNGFERDFTVELK